MPPEPDYRQSAVTGQRWRRALHVECDNGFGQTPSIRFDEEYRTVLTDGSSVGAPAGSVSVELRGAEQASLAERPSRTKG